MAKTSATGYLNRREDGVFRFLGLPTVMRATSEETNGAFGLLEHLEMPVGFASPYHTHHREDESFYVLDGEMAFVCGGEWRKAGPGTFVYGPRDIAHGFQVIGNVPARMLPMCTPGGFEGFVIAQKTRIEEPPSPPDMGRLMTLAAEYGIDIHGPLPAMPEGFGAGSDVVDLESLNRRWIAAFNERDWETERAVRSEDFQAHLSGMAEPLDNAGWAGFMEAFTTGFPDAWIAIESCVAGGDTVATRWTLTGTHRAEFQGIQATGREVTFSGIEFNRVVGGKLAEHWAMFDNLAMLRQLGV